jgi:predicted MFS family arabinose efflux permease
VSLVYGFNHKAQVDPVTGSPATWTEFWTLGPIVAGVVLLIAFFLIEARSPQALLPLRIITNRTRAVSFFVMLVVGAAIFAMFLFLSLYIQQVMGYSPLKSGFAFLPFTFGIVAAAQVASALIDRIDPRWIAGAGGAMSMVAMWGYGRLEVDSTYLTGLLPWIVIQAIGMGLIFVTLTLTAVSGIDQADSGVGSAVLNTVQQVGGAIGIALLGTIYANGIAEKMAELAAAAGGRQPTPEQMDLGARMAQTFGITETFAVAIAMMAVATVVTLVGLSVKHEELATDSSPAAMV